MKKVIIGILAIVVMLHFLSCHSNADQDALIITNTLLKLQLKQKQDSLLLYKKLPYIKATNPDDLSDSVLVKNPRAFLDFRTAYKKAVSLYQEMLHQQLVVAGYFSCDTADKHKDKLLIDFKKKHSTFCHRWAESLLNDQIGLDTDSEEDFENNADYQALRKKIDGTNDKSNNALFDKIYSESCSIHTKEKQLLWNNFKKQNH